VDGDGHALAFDGVGDYVDFGESEALNVAGPVTAELWFKPLACSWGETRLLGNSSPGYWIMFSNRGLAWWCIGTGSYNSAAS